MLEARSRFELSAADRTIFFTDAVVAIAITLLALELPVPAGDTAHELWSSVREDAGDYIAFLVSFVVIAVAWNQHLHVMRYVERSDTRLRALNSVWLLTIVLTPFATKLLTSEGDEDLAAHAMRYGFYSLLQVVASAAFLAMLHHVVSHGLHAPATPPAVVIATRRRCYALIAGFGLSIPVFFLVRWAWVLWILVPVLLSLAHRRWPGRAPGTAQAQE